MPTCDEYGASLTAARAALHAAMLGGAVVEIRTSDGKMIKYSPGNLDTLRRYVSDLQARVDACNGTSRPGRAIRFIPTDD
jgi:gpW